MSHSLFESGSATTAVGQSIDDMVTRASELREPLRSAQREHAASGGYSKRFDDEFRERGFYGVLQPRRFGGSQLGLEAFVRIGIEISRGDPGVGWSYVTGTGHILQLASFFGEEAQRAVFAGGHCVAPARTTPTGRAEKTDGGWRLSGRWEYCSGSRWSTHVALCAANDRSDVPLLLVLPRSDYTILDDWNDSTIMGMQASSSNTVVVSDAFVPDSLAVPFLFRDFVLGDIGTPGTRLHDDPLYVGRQMTTFMTELAITQVGAAWAAVDEYEALMIEKSSPFPPRVLRRDNPEFVAWYGRAHALADAAEVLLIGAVRQYMVLAAEWARSGREFSVEDDTRLRAVVQHAARLADESVDITFTTSGTSSAKTGGRLGKYFRDVSVYRTHVAAQYDVTHSSSARYHFGAPLTL
jgi:3-hydroxy-9,10-secoandrosta-1,3,5(10)-triene-9,17-dione monooxygenase